METWIPIIGAYLFIFLARVIDMSLDVVRILMLMRDRRLLAALIGFAEVTVFIIALNEVIKGGLDDPGKVIAYAGGFATGNYLGSMIESRLALGFLSLQIFPADCFTQATITRLREEGFGVTTVRGQGRDGDRTILFVLLKRKDLKKVTNLMDEVCPGTFFNVSDARGIYGGVFPMRKSK